MLLTLGGCAGNRPPKDPAGLERFEFTKLVMGVKARVVVYSPGEAPARAAAAAAFARMEDLDRILSDYRPDSELSLLPARAAGRWTELSPELSEVLRLARRISDLGDGAFDVTVGAMSREWRAARQEGRLPSPEALAAARAVSGWEKLELHTSESRARVAAPGMRLDLGGIGKGYAAREASRTLQALGARSHLVALAGDIVVGDAPPGADGWRIGIDLGRGSEGSIDLVNRAVSTSGDAAQFVEVDGVRYSHILDPRTGIGVTTRTACVVVAEDGAIADAAATAVCVLGADRGAALLRSLGVNGLVLEGDRRVRVGGW